MKVRKLDAKVAHVARFFALIARTRARESGLSKFEPRRERTAPKSFKLGKKDMEEPQDMAAETLDMERGKCKSETGREHLEQNDYILFQQKKQSAELDIEIAEKREQLNAENGNAIKSGMANLFGKGKYADMEKENKRLKEELPKQNAAMKRQY